MADPTPLSSWNAADEAFGPIFVQEGAAGARRQPAPGVQPMPGMPQPRPQPRPQATAPQPVAPPAPAAPPRPDWNAADEAFGPVFTPPPVGSKLGTSRGDVIGKALRPAYDPLYKDTPAFVDTPGAEEVSTGRFLGAKTLAASDASYADVLAAGIPHLNPQITKDANGYPLITYDGKDGQRITAYANKPGVDMEDVSRGIYGSLPFLATGGMAGKVLKNAGAPLIARVPAQSVVAGVTSGVQDLGAESIGSTQGGDGAKAVGAMIGGAAGELAAPAFGWVGRKISEGRLFNKATGELTEAGQAAARKVGFDPTEWTTAIKQKFAENFAKSGDEIASSVGAEAGDLGILTTNSNRTKNIRDIAWEQFLRDGGLGKAAADKMKAFDDAQLKSIYNATLGEIEPGKPGLSMTLNPARSPTDYAPSQVGAAIAERAGMGVDAMKGEARAAWQKVGTLEAPDTAVAELPRYINRALDGMTIVPPTVHGSGMPVATQMVQSISKFMNGEAPQKAAEFLETSAIREVNKFRQSLSEGYRGLPPGTPDRTAAERIYAGYQTWLREMADNAMLTASNADSAVAAAQMREASGLTYKLHQVLSAEGNKAGANKMRSILKDADSARQVVDDLFIGAKKGTVRPGTMSTIEALQKLASKIGPDGVDLINDLKLAHTLTLVRNPAGEIGKNIYNPQVLLNNLRTSADGQREIWLKLYKPEDIALRNRLIRSLEQGPTFNDWTVKANSSRSATTASMFLIEMIGKLMGGSAAKGISNAVGHYSGIGYLSALKATRQSLPTANPTMVAPSFAAGGAAGAQSQE